MGSNGLLCLFRLQPNSVDRDDVVGVFFSGFGLRIGKSHWTNLKAIGMSINTTIRDGKTKQEIRYYILNKYISSDRFAVAVRTHWGIENSLHWQLDVTFGEDKCRIRKGHADTNFSSLRRTALSLLKNESTAKVGIKNKRLSAGWDEDYLEKVLLG